MRDVRTRKDSAGDVDHLQILGARQRGNVSGLGSDIKVYGSLEPWNLYLSIKEVEQGQTNAMLGLVQQGDIRPRRE